MSHPRSSSAKRRISRRALLAILFGATCLWLLLLIIPGDEAPPADGDLLRRETESGSGSNGVDHLRRIDALDLEGIWEFVESEGLWSSANWTPELAQTTLNRTEPFYRILQECLSAERFVAPEGAYYAESFRWLMGVDDLATYVLLRARAVFAHGRKRAAFLMTLDVLRLARRLENSGGAVGVYLAGKGVNDRVYDQLADMLWEPTISSDELADVQEELVELAWRPAAYETALRAEYGMVAKLIEAMTNGTMTPRQLWEYEFGKLSGVEKVLAPIALRFRPNETRRLYAEMFRFVIGNSERHESFWDLSKAPRVIRSRGREPVRGNEIGRTMANLACESLLEVHEQVCEERAKMSVLLLLLSLRRHHEDKGRLPRALRELVPSYLKEVPVDPYTQGEMAYSPTDHTISSAGGISVKIEIRADRPQVEAGAAPAQER